MAVGPALALLGAIAALAIGLPAWAAILWTRLRSRPKLGSGASWERRIFALIAASAAAVLFWTRLGPVGAGSFPSLGAWWFVALAPSTGTVALSAGFSVTLVWLLLDASRWTGRLRAAAGAVLSSGRSRLAANTAVRRAHAVAMAHASAATALLLLVLVAASRPAAYVRSLEGDVGQYLYVGEVILHGGAPYVDAANNKGPLTYGLFALISLVSDHSTAGVKLSLIVFTTLAAASLAAYVGHFAGRPAGVLAGAAMALMATTEGFEGTTPNTEHYGMAAILGAWWLGTRPGYGPAASAGVALAAAVLINPWFAIFAPFVAYELWRAAPGRARLGVAGAAGIALAGLVLGVLALLGAVDDMLEQLGQSATSAARLGGPVQTGADARELASSLFDVPARTLWELGLLGCLVACFDRRLRRVAAPAALWIVVVWARVKFAGYAFDHYYFPVIAGLSAGIALGVTFLWRKRARVALAVALLALGWSGWSLLARQAELLGKALDARRLGPTQAESAASFVRRHTVPGERIFVVASAPLVYWLADRRAPTRIFDDRAQWRLRPDYAAERQSDLIAHPPAAVVFVPQPREPLPNHVRPILARYRYRVAYRRGRDRVWLLPRDGGLGPPG